MSVVILMGVLFLFNCSTLKKVGDTFDSFAATGKYVGDTVDGKPHGQGVEYDKKGNVTYEGEYKNGKPVK